MSIEQGMREKGMSENARASRPGVRRIRGPEPAPGVHRLDRQGRRDVQHADAERRACSCSPRAPKEADAKPLVSERRSFVVTVPKVRGARRAGRPPVPPVAPGAARAARASRAARVRPARSAAAGAAAAGRWTATSCAATSPATSSRRRPEAATASATSRGRVRILTHSGEIRVGAVGAGADLKTFGGDIVVGPVTGRPQGVRRWPATSAPRP